MIEGSCLCGAVRFSIDGPMRDVLGCHCGQCRKQTGHYWAATSVPDAALQFQQQDGLAWFEASDTVRRGFCKLCGSTLFWKPGGEGRTVVSAGSLEPGTGLRLTQHVFVKDKGDYYEITDGLPQHHAFSGAENA